MRVDEIARAGLSRLDVIRVRTVLNPLLWLVGITTPLSLLGMALMPGLQLPLLGFAALPVLFTLGAYAFWMVRDPDRLQSEEYRIKHRALLILRRRGSTADVVEIAKEPPTRKVEDLTRPRNEQ